MSKLFSNKFCIKNEIIRIKTSKYSTNLSLQKFWYKKSNIKQKPTELNPNPCHILSKIANHLSILNLLIEIFKIQARNAPRILIYYMEKWIHQQRGKFRKDDKISKERQKKKFYEKYSRWRDEIFGKNLLWTERTY